MIGRSVTIVGILHFISRIFGMLRVTLTASLLGTTFIADSFTIAFKLPNILRRFVGEGSMSAAFIPVFSDVRQLTGGDRGRESAFLSRFITATALFVGALCVAGILWTPALVRLLYAFGDQPHALAVFLTRIMFFYLAFVSLAAVAQGVLNANRLFAVPAATSIWMNLAIIACALLLHPFIPEGLFAKFTPDVAPLLAEDPLLLDCAKASVALGIGVLLGGFLQFGSQLPSLHRLGYRIRIAKPFPDPHIRHIGKLMVPGIFALGIHQVNALLADPFVLALLETGSVAALNYSNRLLEFSLGIFVISLSTVILPSLSAHVSSNNLEAYRQLVKKAAGLVIFISIPSTVGLMMLRVPIISLVFKYGQFQDHSAALVADALFYHALGLLPIGLYRIYAPAFYALKDTRTPVVAAGISMVLNLIFCATLPHFMGIGGIALAGTLSAAGNAWFLLGRLKDRFPELHLRYTVDVLWKTLAASLAMGLWIHFYVSRTALQGAPPLHLFFHIGVILISASVIFFAITFVLRTQELRLILGGLLHKNRPST